MPTQVQDLYSEISQGGKGAQHKEWQHLVMGCHMQRDEKCAYHIQSA